MKQGAIKAALSERGNDLNETPECAVRALMRVEILPTRIWDPCAGRGAISRVLKASGHQVATTDLVAYDGADDGIVCGVDFLLETKAPANTIVMNAPYKLDDEFVRHGLSLGCRVIALFRLMYLEGENRSDLIDKHLLRVWAGIERLPMMHREGYEGKKIDTGGMPFAWFVFDPHVRPKGSAFSVNRMSWWCKDFPKPKRPRTMKNKVAIATEELVGGFEGDCSAMQCGGNLSLLGESDSLVLNGSKSETVVTAGETAPSFFAEAA